MVNMVMPLQLFVPLALRAQALSQLQQQAGAVAACPSPLLHKCHYLLFWQLLYKPPCSFYHSLPFFYDLQQANFLPFLAGFFPFLKFVFLLQSLYQMGTSRNRKMSFKIIIFLPFSEIFYCIWIF
ncbi:hypothetical protein ATANTOWER_029843 [Ataeniobius toweri]|uniref:Secreted protein n=1 Tax=Ataeniobius toweri TaxID=208326 RepID=A0ABU7AHJ4_9TELE|nr:hypothetical protein [Ataeniobius toweri]